jgi:hypothetical protein
LNYGNDAAKEDLKCNVIILMMMMIIIIIIIMIIEKEDYNSYLNNWYMIFKLNPLY